MQCLTNAAMTTTIVPVRTALVFMAAAGSLTAEGREQVSKNTVSQYSVGLYLWR